MLRQVYLVLNDEIVYNRNYGKGLDVNNLLGLFPDIKNDAFSRLDNEIGVYDYFKYRVSYIGEKELKLVFILVSGLTDDMNRLKSELFKLKKEFLNLFKDVISNQFNPNIFEILHPIIDGIHRNLKPKISLIGFSGVGKTTITRLIKAEEIPMEHIPTITGEVSTIKIGKLHFHLWDFAGQDQFSFLWNKFIRGSDAILLITDSSLENIEKSKYFLGLINEEAPYAHSAIIGNKQDLPNAQKVEDIERMMGLKTYAMIATDLGNRDKMIQIIADILDMTAEVSPLLKPLFERDQLINDAQKALENGKIEQAASSFKKIGDICIEMGDYSLGNEFYEKFGKLNNYIKNSNL